MIEYNFRDSSGVSLPMTLPEPSRIPIPAVREAVEKVAKRAAQHREARAALATADSAVQRARSEIDTEAADAAEDGGAVPAKKLVKKLRVAQDTLEEARIEFDARGTALRKAHANVVATIRHHAPAWRSNALERADAEVLRVTTAREMLRKAGADLDESLSTLGLLDRLTVGLKSKGLAGRLTIDALPVLTPLDGSAIHVGVALENMGAAIGEAMETLDDQRGAERSKPDVEVPVAGEDVVAETPAAGIAFEMGSDDGEE